LIQPSVRTKRPLKRPVKRISNQMFLSQDLALHNREVQLKRQKLQLEKRKVAAVERIADELNMLRTMYQVTNNLQMTDVTCYAESESWEVDDFVLEGQTLFDVHPFLCLMQILHIHHYGGGGEDFSQSCGRLGVNRITYWSQGVASLPHKCQPPSPPLDNIRLWWLSGG